MSAGRFNEEDIRGAIPGPDGDDEEGVVEATERARRRLAEEQARDIARQAIEQRRGAQPQARPRPVQAQRSTPMSQHGSGRPDLRPQIENSRVRSAPFVEPKAKKARLPGDSFLDRTKLMERYSWFMGAIGLLCSSNSVITTIVGTVIIYKAMFPYNNVFWGMIAGGLLAAFCFLGQIWNADYELFRETTNDAGEQVYERIVNEEMRAAYYFWLTPDAFMTLWFWTVPFVNGLTALFFGAALGATSVRDVATGFGLAWNHSWLAFLVFVVVLGIAVTSASALAVASSRFPEKSLLGPRTRERIKAKIRERVAALGS